MAVYTGFFIFFLILYLICNNTFALDLNNVNQIPKSFLLDVFGYGFYSNNVYCYYLLEGFIKFFLMIFIYSFFAQAIVLININLKSVIVTPVLFYYILTVISFVLVGLGYSFFIYLNPSTIIANSDYKLNSILLLILSLLPFYISIITLIWKKYHVEE